VSVRSTTIVVDKLDFHYLEAGDLDAPAVVLLHSGEFGSSAQVSWGHLIERFASRHRVVAPDWLGYGGSAKVRDFVDGIGRAIDHMATGLEHLGIDRAHLVGSSMGATMLLRDAAQPRPRFPAATIVAANGGGPTLDNEARRDLTGYDGSLESMRRVVRALVADPRLADDDGFVTPRQEEAATAGAWECAASARLRHPAAPVPPAAARDTIDYERIEVPVLLVNGVHDRLKPPAYGRDIVRRLRSGRLVELEDCAHLPNVEQPDRFVAEVLAFWEST